MGADEALCTRLYCHSRLNAPFPGMHPSKTKEIL